MISHLFPLDASGCSLSIVAIRTFEAPPKCELRKPEFGNKRRTRGGSALFKRVWVANVPTHDGTSCRSVSSSHSEDTWTTTVSAAPQTEDPRCRR